MRLAILSILLVASAWAQKAPLDVGQFVTGARHVQIAALQAAMDARPEGGVLRFPAGVYQFITPTQLVFRNGWTPEGEGPRSVLVFQQNVPGLLFTRPDNLEVRNLKFETWGARHAIVATRGPGPHAPANNFRIIGCYFVGTVHAAAVIIQGPEVTAIRDCVFDMQGYGAALAYTSDDWFGTGVQSSPNWTCSGHLLSNVSISAQLGPAIIMRGAVTDLELQRCWIARSGEAVPFFRLEQDAIVGGNWGRTPLRIDLRGVTFEQYSRRNVIEVRLQPGATDAPTYRFPWPDGWETAGSVTVTTKRS